MKNSDFPLLLMLAAIVMLNTDCYKPPSQPPPNAIVPNRPPVVDAGADLTVEIPNEHAKFDVTVSDPDFNLKSYKWSKISGPNSWYIQFENGLDSARAHWMEDGIYEFELTATDSLGLSDKDTVRITVNSNFQKYIKHALLPDVSLTTIVEIPEDIYKSLKWVYSRSSVYCERVDKGPLPGVDYAWGGWYYQFLAGNKLFVYGGYSNEKFDLIIYY